MKEVSLRKIVWNQGWAPTVFVSGVTNFTGLCLHSICWQDISPYQSKCLQIIRLSWRVIQDGERSRIWWMFTTKVLVLLRIDSYESTGLNTQISHALTKNGSSILHQLPSSFRIRRIIHIGWSSRITISVLAWWRREFDRIRNGHEWCESSGFTCNWVLRSRDRR